MSDESLAAIMRGSICSLPNNILVWLRDKFNSATNRDPQVHTSQKQVQTSMPQGIPEGLSSMKHIIFVDFDNWSFWTRLFKGLPPRTFVWGFYGATKVWHDPQQCWLFDQAKANGLWHLHHNAGGLRNAADTTLIFTAGKLDVILPHHIPFTVISGDKVFKTLEEEMSIVSPRRMMVINPHIKPRDELYALICSVAEV